MSKRLKISIILTVLFLSTYFSLPTFLRNTENAMIHKLLPKTSMIFGLDLKGGISLLLEIDDEEYFREDIEKCINYVIESLSKSNDTKDNFKNFRYIEKDGPRFMFESRKNSDIKPITDIIDQYFNRQYE